MSKKNKWLILFVFVVAAAIVVFGGIEGESKSAWRPQRDRQILSGVYKMQNVMMVLCNPIISNSQKTAKY